MSTMGLDDYKPIVEEIEKHATSKAMLIDYASINKKEILDDVREDGVLELSFEIFGVCVSFTEEYVEVLFEVDGFDVSKSWPYPRKK